IFYNKIIIQYNSAFFFGEYEGIRGVLNNFATYMSFIVLFILNRKIEIICHEVEYKTIENTDLLNHVAQKIMWFIAPMVIFHTQKEIDLFKSVMLFGFASKRLELRSHHRDFSKFTNVSTQEARLELSIPLENKIFLCIGFIQPHKGFERAMQA